MMFEFEKEGIPFVANLQFKVSYGGRVIDEYFAES